MKHLILTLILLAGLLAMMLVIGGLLSTGAGPLENARPCIVKIGTMHGRALDTQIGHIVLIPQLFHEAVLGRCSSTEHHRQKHINQDSFVR